MGSLILNAFRVLLIVILVVLAGYTADVIANHGWGLLAVFFGDIGRMEWPGQFNLDFLFMLTLSATWVSSWLPWPCSAAPCSWPSTCWS